MNSVDMSVESERKREYIWGNMFPRREVSLVCGDDVEVRAWLSGKFLPKWSRGESVSGLVSAPASWWYVVDTAVGAAAPKFAGAIRFALDDYRFPLVKVLEAAPERREVYFVEGLHRWVPFMKWRDLATVHGFLVGLRAWCERRDVTVVGTVPGKRRVNVRERAGGCVAWAGHVEGVVVVEKTKVVLASLQDKVRTVAK